MNSTTLRAVHVWVIGLMIAFAGCASAQESSIPNPSFEKSLDGKPEAWKSRAWTGKAEFGYGKAGRNGSNCVSISIAEPADASWSASIPVRPFAIYKLTGWVRTENVEPRGGRGAGILLRGRKDAWVAVTGASDWKEMELTFETAAEDAVQVDCALGGGGKSIGRAWFDDLKLELIQSKPIEFGKIVVDAKDRLHPMSPYIYSQFIEHLGRCIYGGIWAEMLEDRKFYFLITADYKPYTRLTETAFPVVGASPWEIIGPAESVVMVKEKPFVGKHTPSVHAGSGIRQRDLGIVKDKKYAGYAWISCSREPASAEIALVWGPNQADRQIAKLEKLDGPYKKYAFEFTAGAATDKANLEILVTEGTILIGTISLMPADNVEGMRADTLALLKELNAPIYRWPGGNFVSGYDWRDGIGDRDRRPPRTNPAWTGVEHNDYGMHEFIRFCELVQAEPWITVNTGFGDAYSAAAQLEYANGANNTEWGQRRCANGAAKPFAVKYWGIGNEMWGPWQLGYMKLEHYVIKQNWVVDKMREVDPKIFCISSGNAGPWSTGLLKNCANHQDWIAEHFYVQERAGTLAHIRQMNDNIKKKADFHRKARQEIAEIKDKDIKVAMTEWNYWYGPHHFGELGTRYFLKDALGVAAGLHEFARNSDIVASAFYAQTVNVIGCIKTSKTAAAMDSTGLVLALYRKEFGQVPVKTTASELLDIQAMLTTDGKFLTLGIVNPWNQALDLPLEIQNARPGKDWTAWRVVGDELGAWNEPGQAPRVRTEKAAIEAGPSVKVGPRSVLLVKIPLL